MLPSKDILEKEQQRMMPALFGFVAEGAGEGYANATVGGGLGRSVFGRSHVKCPSDKSNQ